MNINNYPLIPRQLAAGKFIFNRPHTGINMHKRTPYQILQDSGLCHVEHALEFPLLILDHDIQLLRQACDFLLLKSELDKKNYAGDLQQFFHASQKYDFFDQSGENVFTNYQLILILLILYNLFGARIQLTLCLQPLGVFISLLHFNGCSWN